MSDEPRVSEKRSRCEHCDEAFQAGLRRGIAEGVRGTLASGEPASEGEHVAIVSDKPSMTETLARIASAPEPAPGVEPVGVIARRAGVTVRQVAEFFDLTTAEAEALLAHPPTDTGAREALEEIARRSYKYGYEEGHHDTVETQFSPEGSLEDFMDEIAPVIISEALAPKTPDTPEEQSS